MTTLRVQTPAGKGLQDLQRRTEQDRKQRLADQWQAVQKAREEQPAFGPPAAGGLVPPVNFQDPGGFRAMMEAEGRFPEVVPAEVVAQQGAAALAGAVEPFGRASERVGAEVYGAFTRPFTGQGYPTSDPYDPAMAEYRAQPWPVKMAAESAPFVVGPLSSFGAAQSALRAGAQGVRQAGAGSLVGRGLIAPVVTGTELAARGLTPLAAGEELVGRGVSAAAQAGLRRINPALASLKGTAFASANEVDRITEKVAGLELELEQTGRQLDEATAHLEGISAPGVPAPKFGTRERGDFDVEHRGKISKSQRMREARAAVRRAKEDYAETKARWDAANLDLDQALSEPVTEAPAQIGVMQAGMGIGERPMQGELLSRSGPGPEKMPLFSPEQMVERQRIAAQKAAGQTVLPEAPAETARPDIVPPAASQAAPEPPGPPVIQPAAAASPSSVSSASRVTVPSPPPPPVTSTAATSPAAAPAAPPPVAPPPAAPPRPPGPPDANLGKFDKMWSEGGKRPPRDLPALYRKLQEYGNDYYWGLRHLQKEVSSRIEITPGGEKDLVTALTRGPGAFNAGATRYNLVINQIKGVARGIPLDDINTIIFANHGKEVMAAKGPQRVIAGGFKSPAELDDALNALRIRLGDAEYQSAEEAAHIVQRVYRDERERLVAEGFLSQDEGDTLAKMYPWYNPIRYVQYAEEEALRGKTAKPLSVVNKGVRRLSDVGSLEAARAPLEVLGEQLIQNEVRIQRNQTAKAIITLALEQPNLGVKKTAGIRPVAQVEGKTVFRPSVQDIPGTLSYWENGKRQIYAVPDWIYDEAAVLNQTVGNPVSSVVGAVNGITRASFTTFSMPFIFANMANDSLTAFMTRGILPHQTVQALAGSLRGLEKDPAMQAFRLAGGFQQRFYERDAKALARDVGVSSGKVVSDNRSFRRAVLDAIPRAGEAGEQAPRLALFRRQLDNTLPGWRTMSAETVAATPEARKAAAEAVELTINFARGGYLVKAANPYVIFLNASMEGLKLPFRSMLTNPSGKRAVALRLAGVGTGTMGLTAYNLSYPEYFDIPDNIRWGSVVVMLPSKEKDQQGNPKPNYVTVIPRTREWGVFLGSGVYAMERMFRDNPADFGVFTRTMAPQLSPISEVPMPQILSELTGQLANWDFYWSSPIVSRDIEQLPRTEQVTPSTSPTIQRIAETAGVSPVRAQHAVQGVFGGAGRAVTSVSDYILDMVAPRDSDPRILGIVERYEALESPTARRTMLTGLDPMDREAVLREMRQPERGIPIVSPVSKRFVPGRGGQLQRTGERVAEAATGLSAKTTRAAGQDLARLSDVFLDEQKASDTRLAKRVIDAKQWRDARNAQADQYQGALKLLGIQFPRAAQVQQDKTVANSYYDAVATLAGATPDRRDRAQILAAGWYAIPLDATVPESPDFATFFEMRDSYRNKLSPEDRGLLNEHLAARQTPTEQKFEADKEQLRPYWNIERDMVANMAPELKERWRQGDQYIASRLAPYVSKAHESYRMQHPDVDAALIRWGYATKPVTEQGAAVASEAAAARSTTTQTQAASEVARKARVKGALQSLREKAQPVAP